MIIILMKVRVLGLLLPLLLVMASCSGTQAADTGKLDVVVSFYPFQYVVAQVGGSYVNVANLTQPGVEPHDLELTPKQVASLTTADLVVYEKGMQPAVDTAVDTEKPKHVLDTTSLVPLKEFSASSGQAGQLDPHTWLDPLNMATFANGVAAQLSALDPTHASDYQTAAQSFATQMSSIDASYTAGLATCQRTVFITTHAAFGYLADRYHLTQIGISGLSPDEQPSAARIAEIQQKAKADGITTIFYETLVSPAVAKTIAGDLNLATDVLDPIEGVNSTSRGTDYPSIMASNLTALQKANGCS